mmetsp:Transcript_2843/g.4395  ORF Transcript_2843/g.4395 Transcript_2843/m.4395 type:complete len:313 (+) Transcript_2843:58-996(+)
MSDPTTKEVPSGKSDGLTSEAKDAKRNIILYENLIDMNLRKGIKSENPILDHRCQLFNSPQLLFDKLWLGSDDVRIELVTNTKKQAQAAVAAFKKQFSEAGLSGNMSIENTASSEGESNRSYPEGCNAVRITDVKITPPVKPEPLLALIGALLWIEPNKLEKLEEKDRWVEILGGEEGTAKATQQADIIREKIVSEMKKIETDQKLVLKALKRLQKFSQIPARQSKLADVFMYLQKKRQQLKVLSGHARNVAKMYCCSVCGSIIQIVGRPLPPEEEKKLKSLPASKLEWPQRLVMRIVVEEIQGKGKQAKQQ